MESTLKNMVLTLFIITFVSATAVGFVYQVTKGPIAEAKSAKITAAIALVLPEFDNDIGQTRHIENIDGGQVIVYTATNNGKVVGYAVETFTNKGFRGEIRLMVGFLPDGTINKVETVYHSETPGFGDKIERGRSDFSVQFEGQNPSDFKLAITKDGGDVDAITASTITSRAFVDAVERACRVFQSIKTAEGNKLKRF